MFIGERKSKAFTLVELLLVVTIIGILAAAILPSLVGRTEEARVTRCRSDIRGTLGVALDLFEADVGRYPNSDEGLEALYVKPQSVEEDLWKGPYLKQRTMPKDPWKRVYEYRFPSERAGMTGGEPYDLFSPGADGISGTGDDVTNWAEEE
jgi:general secretion pathway protein G